MSILVDADACPVKHIILKHAKLQNIPVFMFIDTAHEINDGYSTVITVDQGRDSVDLALINSLKPHDIVVTQDYGVAALALGKGAAAINQNGLVYNQENIDGLLMNRHLGQKSRRTGKYPKGCAKRTLQDDEKFEAAFAELITLQQY